jgi:hypothetical protein
MNKDQGHRIQEQNYDQVLKEYRQIIEKLHQLTE